MRSDPMILAKVVGTVVATQKDPSMEGLRLMLVQPVDMDGKAAGAHVVAVDAVGSGPGEYVLFCTGSSARQTRVTDKRPCDAVLANAESLAREAQAETGFGRWEDKFVKNRLVTTKTPGTEHLRPEATSGDHGLMLMERAPFGVIAALTPSTNPTSTIICNTI